MPTLSELPGEPHHARQWAESFGADPDRYDRTRPSYPAAMVERIVAAAPVPEVLDVGIGTGIAARQFRACVCRVLGVEVDPRMAAFARRAGFAVEVAPFETWEPAGRLFDVVVAGQTWHWIDPEAGTRGAAQVLRPGGRLAVFWNVFRPSPEVAEAFTEVYRRVAPDALSARTWRAGADSHAGLVARTRDGIDATGAFDQAEQWHHGWERRYTRDEWLDQIPTFGDSGQLAPEVIDRLLDGIGAAIDALGGVFTMAYTTVAVTAVRRSSD